MPIERRNVPGLAQPPGYSHVAIARGSTLVFTAGAVPLDAAGELVGPDDPVAQTSQVIANLLAALAAAGADPDDVVKTTVFLADLADFKAMNEVYASHFTAPFPARSTVQVAALPAGARVEIEALAIRPSGK